MCVNCGGGDASLPVVTGPQGPAGNCDCSLALVVNTVERLGALTSGDEELTTLTGFTYTVPVGVANGIYTVIFSATVDFLSEGQIQLEAFKNGVSLNTLNNQKAEFTDAGLEAYNVKIPISYNCAVTMSTGDVFEIKSASTAPSTVYLSGGSMQIVKIA